jgi:Ca2+-binding EF-hand superfamily protein
MKRLILASALAIAAILGQGSAHAAPSPIQKLDTDKDGTLDLNEIKTSVESLFTSLEKDADGTLDARELRGKLSGRDLKSADPDSDKTLTKEELMSYVESLFRDVDADNDGTVDAKELKSKKGKTLLRLTR